MRGILNEAQPGVSRNTGGADAWCFKAKLRHGEKRAGRGSFDCVQVEGGEGFCVPVLLSRKLERG